MKTNGISLSVVSLVMCFFGQTALADQITIQNLNEFKLKPQGEIWGYMGDQLLVEGQARIPLLGDQENALYVLTEGNIGKYNAFMLGSGAGYRRVINENLILGGYGALAYNKTKSKNNFWILSPGFDVLGQNWDIAINGYFPINSKKAVSREGYASEFGVYKYTSHSGRNEYDHRMREYDEAANGVDFDIGYVIPHFEKIKAYVGGYYFRGKEAGSLHGVEARIKYDFNRYISGVIEDNFDNKNHNEIVGGIKFNLGGYSSNEKDAFGISSRLLDPIDRDIAILKGSELAPLQRMFVDLGKSEQPAYTDILYFISGQSDQSDIGENDGTYEHPFVGFTKTNYDKILAYYSAKGATHLHLRLYFAPGTYNFSTFANSRFALPNGWGMYGRDRIYINDSGDDPGSSPPSQSEPIDYYQSPAFNGSRAFFTNSAIDLINCPEETTLNSIRIENNMGVIVPAPDNNNNNAALYANDAANVVLKNIDIANSYDTPYQELPAQYYVYAIYSKNSNIKFDKLDPLVNVAPNENTNITSNLSNNSGGAEEKGIYSYGIYAADSMVTFANGNNHFIAKSYDQSGNAVTSNAYGIYADNSTINFTAEATHNSISVGRDTATSLWGIWANGTSHLQQDSKDVTNLGELLANFTEIISDSSYSQGNKIEWINHDPSVPWDQPGDGESPGSGP